MKFKKGEMTPICIIDSLSYINSKIQQGDLNSCNCTSKSQKSGEWCEFINRKGKRGDGSERWEAHYFCVDVENAIVALAKLRLRLIDSSVPDEIKAVISGDYE